MWVAEENQVQRVLTHYLFFLPYSFEVILLFGIEAINTVCPFGWTTSRCGKLLKQHQAITQTGNVVGPWSWLS
jgi:hypothetical protein